jgi:hypothetical protein
MNPIKFECPQCHEIIASDESSYGRRVKCRKCQAEMLVPQAPVSTGPQTARLIQEAVPAAPLGPDEGNPETDIFTLSPVARAFPGQILLGVIFVRRGWFAKHVDELELYRVKDVTVDQGFLQRLLGYGTITVFSDDESTPETDLMRIPGPMTVKEMIRTQYRAARRREGVRPTEFMP